MLQIITMQTVNNGLYGAIQPCRLSVSGETSSETQLHQIESLLDKPFLAMPLTMSMVLQVVLAGNQLAFLLFFFVCVHADQAVQSS